MRKGNPKGIKDWDDLVKPGVEVITPNPKTSGGARWNYLAAWGYVLKRELGDLAKLHDPKQADAVAKAQAKAREFVTELFAHVTVLDSGARGSTHDLRAATGMGDVLLAWENEAFYSVNDMKTGREVRDRRPFGEHPGRAAGGRGGQGRRQARHAEGGRGVPEVPLLARGPDDRRQALLPARATRKAVAAGVPEARSPKSELFTIDDVFGGWQKAQAEHFDDGGVFDQISAKPNSETDGAIASFETSAACCPASA